MKWRITQRSDEKGFFIEHFELLSDRHMGRWILVAREKTLENAKIHLREYKNRVENPIEPVTLYEE